MFKKIIISILAFIIQVDSSFAQNKIIFNVPIFPPYMLENDGKISGIGVELVEKIMKEAGVQYVLKIVPSYARALEDVKDNKSDGFFLASQSAERDKFAVFSNTIMINRWCWFYPAGSTLNPKDIKFKSEAKVGTYLNSNTHKWLLENGYIVTGSPQKIDSLLKMLNVNNINVVFLAELVFIDSIHKMGGNPDSYIKVIQEEKPFGIYISKEYLSKNKGVMEKINAAIKKIINKPQ
ncbi:substrate-binding periplasmic protein [Iodobacter fluviatilis]|uniref:Solute-binding protein family 3/N-terminal domain-containing protein n=1 Tax=Iodobacter fluviatilis TaxID=537 RepID=A0A7G3G6I4_9NEIS|nr:transporter substrate-binding domain-containing protein [Iodobacter fluviatilis]QBC42623.1 hypothetical protein C1H71_02995 [Iodobacter fluviatilis]